MFKIHRGNTRIAIVLYDDWVFKVPNIFGLRTNATIASLKLVHESGGLCAVYASGFLGKLRDALIMCFFAGIKANVAEGWLWLRTRSKVLKPTTSFVLFNVQRYAGDDKPSSELLLRFRSKLPPRPQLYLDTVDAHEFEPCNWRMEHGRLTLIDYGGDISNSSSLTTFFVSWNEEIERAADEAQKDSKTENTTALRELGLKTLKPSTIKKFK